MILILYMRLRDEARYIDHTEWDYANASVQLSGASAECFPQIDRVLEEYLTEEMLHDRGTKLLSRSIIIPK
ncbi:hypothetical protein F8M41_012571 [Gigaspora margarita]|uniref:Uncharacterized protein n=1 Tax=Gigaspora margarita TaxID=4874 RepID=A0A8H4AT63_GIGMA|nr:hypothetical protein F8M41_012571 [Gigaspora margarita]